LTSSGEAYYSEPAITHCPCCLKAKIGASLGQLQPCGLSPKYDQSEACCVASGDP